MPRERTRKAINSRLRAIRAIELRASGATYEQIGASLVPSVSRQRAFRIVQSALDELVVKTVEKTEHHRQLALCRLNRMRRALDPNASDPRVAHVLLQIMDREAKLLGLYAPVRIEPSVPDMLPTQTQEESEDLSKLSLEELLELERLHKKMHRDGPALSGPERDGFCEEQCKVTSLE